MIMHDTIWTQDLHTSKFLGTHFDYYDKMYKKKLICDYTLKDAII